jgi:hypothetical protein
MALSPSIRAAFTSVALTGSALFSGAGCVTLPATLQYEAAPDSVEWLEASGTGRVMGSRARLCGLIVSPGSPNHDDLRLATRRATDLLPDNESLEVLSIQSKIVIFPLVSICYVKVIGFGQPIGYTPPAPPATPASAPPVPNAPSTAAPVAAPTADSTPAPTPDASPATPTAPQATTGFAPGTYAERFRRGFGLTIRDAAEECDAGSITACTSLGVYLTETDDAALQTEGEAIRAAACTQIAAEIPDTIPGACEE